MAKIWRSRDIIGAEDAQRWENKADLSHRHKVADMRRLTLMVTSTTETTHTMLRNNKWD